MKKLFYVLKSVFPFFFSEKKLTFILENHFLPGITSLSLCRLSDLLIVTHKNSDQSSSKRSFTLPETPILIYPLNSQWNVPVSNNRNVPLNAQQNVLSNNPSNVPRFLKLVGCKGAVVQQRIMEERGLFLGLTNEGIVNIWSYKKNRFHFLFCFVRPLSKFKSFIRGFLQTYSAKG